LICGLALLETVDALLPLDQPAPDVYLLCLGALTAIEAAQEPLAALCWADLKLMQEAGFSPEFAVSADSGKELRGPTLALSPSRGGALLLVESTHVTDALEVPREIVITLAKLQALQSPPEHLKRVKETASVLLAFWREFASRDLPARAVLATI
jgi:recombinational DNA repair protein (RecF pathway)